VIIFRAVLIAVKLTPYPGTGKEKTRRNPAGLEELVVIYRP
jgi:hypothetical protein